MNLLYVFCVVLGGAVSVFAQGKGSGGGFAMGSLLPMMLVMFVVIYFFMIRPEQKKQKEKQAMLKNITKGAKVITIGGMHGTVTGVKDDHIMIRVADNTTVKFSKSAIATVTASKDEAAETEEENKS